MLDNRPMGTIDLRGTALVFVPITENAVYKVELSRVAASTHTLTAERYADGAWNTYEIVREEQPALLEWIEESAKRLAPEEYQWWEQRFTAAPRRSQAERITGLVNQIMSKFDMTQKAVADRVGTTRQTLHDYSQGRGKGNGVTLELALEGLLARPVFGFAEDDQP